MIEFDKPLVFVDVETTGGSPVQSRIIEIALIRFEDGKEVQRLSTLINPECIIPPAITEITGIQNADVEFAPTFSSVADDILDICKDAVFVAHNVRFDYGFVLNELKRAQKLLSMKTLCTVRLSRLLYPKESSHSLDAIIERLNLKVKDRHRAEDDTKVMIRFIRNAIDDYGQSKVSKAIKKLLGKSALPPSITDEDIEALPETPGVYEFYADGTRPIYVGKSVNIRKRVLSHFQSMHTATKESKIFRQITSIEYTQTLGELGALLLEATKIKQWQPLYNRKQRRNSAQCVIELQPNSDGFLVPSYLYTNYIEPSSLDQYYGLFTKQKAAEKVIESIADQHNLCEYILGIHKATQPPCFRYQLGKCSGACVGELSAEQHNLQLTTSLEYLRHVRFPFDGVIAITEESVDTKQTFFIDDWTLVGVYHSDSDYFEQTNDMFDIQMYQIIRSFLKKNPHKLKLLSREEFESLQS